MEIKELFRVNDKVIDYLGITAKEYTNVKDKKAMAENNRFGRMSLSYQIAKAIAYFIYEDDAIESIGIYDEPGGVATRKKLTLRVNYHGVNHVVLYDETNSNLKVLYDNRKKSDLEEYHSYTWVHTLIYLVKEYMGSSRLKEKIKSLYNTKSFYKMEKEFLSMADEIYFSIKKNPIKSVYYDSISTLDPSNYIYDLKKLIFNEQSEDIYSGINSTSSHTLEDKKESYKIDPNSQREESEERVEEESKKTKTSKKKKKPSKTIFDTDKINITKKEWNKKEKAFISKDPGDLEVDKDKVALLNEAIKRRMSVLLIGDTGTGKTTLVEKLSHELQLPLYEVVASNDAESDLFIGKNTIEDGEVKFIPGQITKPLLNGGIALVDEFNAMNPGINIALHSVLDDRRRLEILDYGKPIQAHDDFFFIATMNEGDIYSGVNKLNQATKRRFDLVLRFDYLSEEKEMEIIMSKAGGTKDEKLASNIVGVLNLCRRSQENHDLLNPADTGTGIKWYKFAQIIGAKKAAEVTLIETVADDDTETKLIREHVRAYFG